MSIDKYSETNTVNVADSPEEEAISVINTKELKLKCSNVPEILVTHFRHRNFSTLKVSLRCCLALDGKDIFSAC